MSTYGSQKGLNMTRRVSSKADLSGGGTYARSEVIHGGGNGYDPYMDGYNSYTFTSKTSMGGGMSSGGLNVIQQKAMILQGNCQDYLKKAEYAIQTGNSGDAERFMAMAKETIEQLKSCAVDLRQMGQPNDNVVRSMEICKDQLKGVHMAWTGSMRRRKSHRASSVSGIPTGGGGGGWEEPPRSYQDAMAWIAQHKRLTETASWGDDPSTIEQQLISHQRFHSTILRSQEVDKARDELMKKGDRANLHALDQEWDSLQQMSVSRIQQLRDLLLIIQEISNEIMWVNDREEEELVFDWGDKNIDQYIPRKQESYSKLMSALEEKEKDLNKLKTKGDMLLKNNHPASDKIEAYRDTLQTQWSWLLQITKCIDVHLKENAAYNQFFKEANETYTSLQKEHETVRKRFTCDKETPLENLLELLKGLEREREKIKDHKRQVQHLVIKSKSIVRLKPRNPEEPRSSNPVIVKALCDFKQDQKVILKDNEAILKDNSQRSKWHVTGPGGLDMMVPSVCLIIPPANPISISLANKNEQYYEAILSVWNQLYINVKSLIAWQYCLMDIQRINSLTLEMLAKMRPEEYRQIIKNLEARFEEFKLTSQGSQLFAEEDKRSIETQFNVAQAHYDQLVVELPTYVAQHEQTEVHEVFEEHQQQQLQLQQQQPQQFQVVEQHQQQILLQAPPQPQFFIIQQHQTDEEVFRLEQMRRLEIEETRRLEEEAGKAEEVRKAKEAARKAEEEARRLKEAEERRKEMLEMKKLAERKVEMKKETLIKSVKAEPVKRKSSSSSSSYSTSFLSLTELQALRLRLESAESTLSQHIHICLGDEGLQDCSLKIQQLEMVQRDVDLMREVYLNLRERIMKELDGMSDSDKAQFLRTEIGVINQRLGGLESSASAYLQRLRALRDMLESVARTEDIVKVHEARLTEKETTSLTPREVETYISTLKNLKVELENKKDMVSFMETELSKATHWNGQVSGPYHRCDMMLSKYTEQVNQLSDRWKRIQTQIDTRLQDLQLYLPKLTNYRETSTSLLDWIDTTRKQQDALQATKANNVESLRDLINNQKALNSEIIAKRGDVDSVLKDNEVCVTAIKEYETDLTSYSSGLETILNVPIKRTMLKSPSMDLNLEATQIQTRYMELLTLSGDYYKFFGELFKNMEELKIRNTKIDLLEEELRVLRDEIKDHNTKDKSLEDALNRYQLEISQSKKELLSMQEIMSSTELKYNTTKENLDSIQSQLADLNEQLSRVKYLLEEEKRKRRLAEERYTQQEVEYDKTLKKWQNQVETVSWSKIEVEKSVTSKDREIEQLRRQLDDESQRVKDLQREMSKERDRIHNLEEEHRLIKMKQETAIKQEIQITSTVAPDQKQARESSSPIFEGVRKPVTAQDLVECGLLEKNTFDALVHGQRTIPEVSEDKRIILKGTGPIAGVIIERPKAPGSIKGSSKKFSFTEAKKKGILPPNCADLLLDAQAATGHIIDPKTNRKLTVDEACSQGVADKIDQERLLAAEAAAVGYGSPDSNKPISAFEAMKKGQIDKTTTLRLLQAQEAVGGILDPVLSVFLPKETAIERDLIDEHIYHDLYQEPELYMDPESEEGTTYMFLKRKCKVEPYTGLLLLPVPEKIDPAKLIFDGVRKPVTSKQLLDCGVLDKSTFNDLEKGTKTVPEVSADKRIPLKGTGPIAGIVAGKKGKMSLAEAKKQMILSPECADLLLEAQAATGHIIDPQKNKKLTVEEACKKEVIDISDREELLAAEAAAVGYIDPYSAKPLSVFEAMKNELVDSETGLRLLQAQESVGGILDPKLSVFLPEDTAIERNILDENTSRSLSERPKCYIDPETEEAISYSDLKKRCKTEPQTGLLLLPVSEKHHPSKLIFDGVRKPVTAQQLHDCEVIDKPTLRDLQTEKKSIPEVSADKKINLKGTGPIAGIISGNKETFTLTEAKKKNLLPSDCADLLLEAQAATGHIIDTKNNKKLTVDEACKKKVVDVNDRDLLLAAEAAAVGYKDPYSAKPLSVFEAMKKELVDDETTLRLLQAQESVGGILDPNLSVFLPMDTAIKRNIFDDIMNNRLNQSPKCYTDPETEEAVTYNDLKKRCKIEPHTGLLLLPVTEKLNPSKLIFDGVRKPVTAKQLHDCKIIDKPTLKELQTGKKSVPEVSEDKKVNLKGTGPIAGLIAENEEIVSLTEGKKNTFLSSDCADLLLEAQAATGHIIDPKHNKKLTVEEACTKKVVDKSDRNILLAAEAAAVGYKDPYSAKPLSVFEAMKKGLVDDETGLRLLQAQKCVGGILDPNISVFLPKDTAIEHNILDENTYETLTEQPKCYIDPATEEAVSYSDLKKKCKTEPKTGLLLLPVTRQLDPSQIILMLHDCEVIDNPTLKDLQTAKKSIPAVSVEKKVNLKGTGPIAGIIMEKSGKMSLSDAKNKMVLPSKCADLLLEAQAATGHIIDPKNNKKLTVDEACDNEVVDSGDRDKLLEAEAAAVGYKDPYSSKPLSVFEAMKKGLVDDETGLRLLQAQKSVGGILDPKLSVFLPKDTAIERKILDEGTNRSLNQKPKCYIDPETEEAVSYDDLKKRCKTEPQTGLLLLPVSEKLDASKIIFDGVRKPVTAKQLNECEVLDKSMLNDLQTEKKSVPEVSKEKIINLKGTGPIAGVTVGKNIKMSLAEAKKKMIVTPDCADFLLEAQAATGHIIDPKNNKKLTVDEACTSETVDSNDRDKLLFAEKAALGYKDPHSAKPLSVFEAMKKGLVDDKTGLRLLQAQESVGGILDPNLSVFLPKDTAIRRKILDENTNRSLMQKTKCYIDPETEEPISYDDLKKRCKTEPQTGLLLLPVTEKLDPSKIIFDGVRKPVTAELLRECDIVDGTTLKDLQTEKKSVKDVSVHKRSHLSGSGAIAGIIAGKNEKAATGYIIDPNNNKKLTVDEAYSKKLIDSDDRDRLLVAEKAAVGFKDPHSAKLLSVFDASKKGLIDDKSVLRLLQAQESVGGILDPSVSVYLSKDIAIKRNLLDENILRSLNTMPKCYIDPESEEMISYNDLKKRCKREPQTGLLLLPVTEKQDASKLIFDGIRKSVTARQLFEYNILDKLTLNYLETGRKSLSEVSADKKGQLKGNQPIAGVIVENNRKMSLAEAKKQMFLSPECADLLLEAQASTGYIIDPKTNLKLTVEEAYNKGMLDLKCYDRLLIAEAAAVGFQEPNSSVPISVFEALKKGIVDKKTTLHLLQAQEAAGGIIDPKIGIFLPKDTAIKRQILDDNLYNELMQNPNLYIDPDTEKEVSYNMLKKMSKVDSSTGLLLLPIKKREDPSKIMFESINKQISAQQLFDYNVIDKTTLMKLIKGEISVAKVSEEKTVSLKGSGAIAGVEIQRQVKMPLSEAKKYSLIPSDSADLLLEAQAATGHIIDPKNNSKLTVNQALSQRLVDVESKDRLLEAEAAAIGFKDSDSEKRLPLYQAMKKGLVKSDTAMRLLQAQMSVGGILDPNLGVFFTKDSAIKHNLLDEDTWNALNKNPKCYIDPKTGESISYKALQDKCITDTHSGLKFLSVSQNIDPSKLIFDGVRKSISAQQLLECEVIDKHIFHQLITGLKSVNEVFIDKMLFLKGTGSIAGVAAGPLKKMSFTEAKKLKIMSDNSIDLLLEAQAATGLIIDPKTNEKMSVKDACAKGVVDKNDEAKLYAAEAAAIGYKDPTTNTILSAGQAFKRGLIEKDTTLRVLQAQEAAGGILDPVLSIFFPKNIALARNLIDEEIYQALNASPQVYLDPNTQQKTNYISIKKKCKADPNTGLLLLPEPKKQVVSVPGLRRQVSLIELVESDLLKKSDIDLLEKGELTSQDIEARLRPYLRGSNCIAGIYNEACDKVITIYEAMKNGLLRPGTTLELLEAQAASGFIIDPINNDYLSVDDAYSKRLFGPEFKQKLLSAERAVTGYKMPGTDKIISLFQAMDKGLIEKGHGIRLLEAQIASGGIIDPEHSHRINVDIAYKKGYFDEKMNTILTDDSDDTKGFFDPNTQENLTYLELQKRCIKDKTTGLLLLPIVDKKKHEKTQKNTLRRRKVVIVDPETNKEMTVREAYDKGYIDEETFLELAQQDVSGKR
ncbi:hypothetical protein WMY93_025419 [Mugilogobius chulae]|uniref:Desmoplakin n=1 Tax=Mugilogobius chulae TaxID=88201 RepID=A0AAW0NEJ4_9GOBI